MAGVKSRSRIPPEVAAEVLFIHHHTCCVCNESGRPIQIHHINENPADHRIDNLAVLRLEDHDRTQVRGGFGRRLGTGEVISYRDDWVQRVAHRRQMADVLAAEKMSVAPTVSGASWAPPGADILVAYINELPRIHKRAYEAAWPKWDSGVSLEMNEGAYGVVDVLERIWIHLASWYPPHHFSGKPSDQYVAVVVAARFEWHRAINEPFGSGTGGTILTQIAAGGVMEDLGKAVAETVRALIVWNSIAEVDLADWDRRWSAATERA